MILKPLYENFYTTFRLLQSFMVLVQILFQIFYIAFLLLHSYMILLDFKPDHVTPIEIACHIWTLAFLVDDFYATVSIVNTHL